MKSKPGDIFRNLNRNVGVGKFTKDFYVRQHVPIIPIQEELGEKIIEETKQEEDEQFRRSQVEQTEIPSRSESPRKQSPRSSNSNRQNS